MDLLARFRRPRGRTTSLSGSAAPALGSASTSDSPGPPPPPPPPPLQPSIERRIHPDLDSLVANWIPPSESTDPPSTPSPAPAVFSTALRPSTRRHSVHGAPPFVATRANAQLEEVREVTDSPPRPPPSTSSPAPVGWSTFGRRDTASRPRLTDFGFGEHSVSPAVSRQHSLSAPSSSNLSTDEFGVAYDARDVPSPASGFTFGSRGRAAGAASSISPPPPMPALDHPAFRSPPSAMGRETRSSSSLPASIRSSSSRRKRKAQEIFSALALSRPASARRQLSLDAEGAPVLELELPEREEEGRDARRKRVAGSSDTEVGERAHQSESSSSTMGHKKISSLTAMSAPPPPPASAGKKSGKLKAVDMDVESSNKATVTVESRAPTTTATSHSQKRARGSMDTVPPSPGIGIAPPNAIPRAPSLSSPSPSHSHASLPLPVSALVSPHAPSIVRSAGGTGSGYYMQDPRKAQRVQPTGWGLSLRSVSGKGKEGSPSPVHAWLFFLGFVLFPIWAVGGFCLGVPRTRRLHGEEKGEVVLDDPQLEFDARSWQRRCRIMAGVSLVTYVPFIVLVAVFVPRGR